MSVRSESKPGTLLLALSWTIGRLRPQPLPTRGLWGWAQGLALCVLTTSASQFRLLSLLPPGPESQLRRQ